jgi:Mg2+ and Co2+ transporter CorA
MATAQQQPMVFDAKEAERFAALWAGFDTGNTSEAEAMGKGRVMRRMAAERNLRIVDALELPEIRQALDDQMQPVRQAVPDVAAMQAELEDLRGKLAFVVPKLREVTDALAKDRTDAVEGMAMGGGIFLGSALVAGTFGMTGGIVVFVLALVMLVIFWKD